VSPGEPLSTPLGSRGDVFPTLELVTASIQLSQGSSLPGGDCPGICQDLSAALRCSSPQLPGAGLWLPPSTASPISPSPSLVLQSLALQSHFPGSSLDTVLLPCPHQPLPARQQVLPLAKTKSFCKARLLRRGQGSAGDGKGTGPSVPTEFQPPFGALLLGEKKLFFL